ncbi:MAG: hypothetical protein IK083_07190 [Abditibacteriota bacterium]|nr:hypothetical protein [Abditibacteriota bacterium]
MRTALVLLLCLFVLCGCRHGSSESARRSAAAREFRQKEEVLDKEIKTGEEEARKKDEQLRSELEEIPEVRVDTGNVTFEWAGEKGKSMSAHARRFSGRQTDSTVSLEDFSASVYDREAKYAADLIADRAVLYARTGVVECSGRVKVTSAQNASVLVAQSIKWDSRAGKIYATSARLTTDMGIMSGKKMVLDTALQSFEVSD